MIYHKIDEFSKVVLTNNYFQVPTGKFVVVIVLRIAPADWWLIDHDHHHLDDMEIPVFWMLHPVISSIIDEKKLKKNLILMFWIDTYCFEVCLIDGLTVGVTWRKLPMLPVFRNVAFVVVVVVVVDVDNVLRVPFFFCGTIASQEDVDDDRAFCSLWHGILWPTKPICPVPKILPYSSYIYLYCMLPYTQMFLNQTKTNFFRFVSFF